MGRAPERAGIPSLCQRVDCNYLHCRFLKEDFPPGRGKVPQTLPMTRPWVRRKIVEGPMRITRKVAVVLATVGLSLGLVGITAPAQADTSWGCGGYCIGTTR